MNFKWVIKMQKFGDRIKRIRTERKMSQEEFANLLGTSKQVISRYETNQRTPKITVANKYAKMLGVSLNWLLGEDKVTKSYNPDVISVTGMIPIVGIIHAGEPIFEEENIEGYLPTMVKDPENYFYLRVHGDSMINAGIIDGSLVLVHKQPTAENGQIVACRVNGDEATLKRLKQVKKNVVVLIPENSNYQPVIVKCSDFESGYAEIIGVAKQVIRNL